MAKFHEGKLSLAQTSFMGQIGLSADAIQLYKRTLALKQLTAAAAAGDGGKFASAQYRLFYKLERYGLVRRVASRPRIFVAVKPEQAFPIAFHIRKAELAKQLEQELPNVKDREYGNGNVITGRDELYETYVQLANKAERSIDVYSIGIAHSKKLVAVQRQAIDRGVLIRHVVQEVQLRNLYVIRTWQKLGIELRRHHTERGFHLMIFDESIALVSFSNPHDTEERISLVLTNAAAVQIYRIMFEEIWQSSAAFE